MSLLVLTSFITKRSEGQKGLRNMCLIQTYILAIKTGAPGFIDFFSITDWAVIETERLWNRNKFREKPVLKHGSYPAFTKHGSITDRAVLEKLSLNSTSGQKPLVVNKFFLRILWFVVCITYIYCLKQLMRKSLQELL